MNILHIMVGENPKVALGRTGQAMQALLDGAEPAPWQDIGFENMAQLGEVFTPKRWELVESLKSAGSLSIYALAKRLKRHYRNVHQDVSVLMEWLVIEKDDDGKIFVPWDEIDVNWPLMSAA